VGKHVLELIMFLFINQFKNNLKKLLLKKPNSFMGMDKNYPKKETMVR